MLPQPGDLVCAGIDMGLRSDSSALVVVHKRGHLLRAEVVLELRPSDDAPLKPSTVVRTFAKVMLEQGCTYAIGDRHYRESVVEYLAEFNLAFVDAPGVPADVYMRARALFREGRVRIPRNERLIRQLREVIGRPMPGGGMSITQPRWRDGGHGDLVSALVLGIYQLGGEPVPAPEPDQDEMDRIKRRQAVRERQEKPWWKGGAKR